MDAVGIIVGAADNTMSQCGDSEPEQMARILEVSLRMHSRDPRLVLRMVEDQDLLAGDPFAGVTAVTAQAFDSAVMRPRTVLRIGGSAPADIRIWRMGGLLSPETVQATLRGSVSYDYRDDPPDSSN